MAHRRFKIVRLALHTRTTVYRIVFWGWCCTKTFIYSAKATSYPLAAKYNNRCTPEDAARPVLFPRDHVDPPHVEGWNLQVVYEPWKNQASMGTFCYRAVKPPCLICPTFANPVEETGSLYRHRKPKTHTLSLAHRDNGGHATVTRKKVPCPDKSQRLPISYDMITSDPC